MWGVIQGGGVQDERVDEFRRLSRRDKQGRKKKHGMTSAKKVMLAILTVFYPHETHNRLWYNCIRLSPEAPHLWTLAVFIASRKCPQARPFSGTSIQVNLTSVIRLVLPNSSILGLTHLPTNFQNGGSDKAQLHKLCYTYLLGFWDFRGKSGRASTLLSEKEAKH